MFMLVLSPTIHSEESLCDHQIAEGSLSHSLFAHLILFGRLILLPKPYPDAHRHSQ